MISVFVVTALLSWTDALAGAKTYGATKPYTYEQKIRRGERQQVKMTVARRVYMGHIGDNLVCIYVGTKKSNETIVTGKDDRCPGSMMVPFVPNPDFDWRETLEKMK